MHRLVIQRKQKRKEFGAIGYGAGLVINGNLK